MTYRPILSAQYETYVLDFGTGSDLARLTIADERVVPSTQIIISHGVPSADHDAEDAVLEGVVLTAVAMTGSYEIIAHAPFGTWGRYNVQALCIYA